MEDHLSVVAIGHVDSGKSTITGRLLYYCGGIDKRTIEKIERGERGEWIRSTQGMVFAHIVDRLRVEQERGITINATLWQFHTQNRQYTIINTPGHRDFIKNTITGTSQADVALLIVAATPGEFEAGLCVHGQTKEHALLAFTLGIKQMIVGVNKMDDKFVAFSQARFEEIQKEVSAMVKKIGFNAANVLFVPISGTIGDNMIKKSDNMPWWKGPTLLQALDSLEKPKRAYEKPLRIPICCVYKISGIGTVAVGKIVAGELKEGMIVTFAPSNISTEVASIEMHHQPLKTARAGDCIGFNIKTVSRTDIRRGYVASDAKQDTAFECESFLALVVILRHPTEIRNGYCPLICCHTCQITCKWELISKIEKRSGKVLEEAPHCLKSHEMGMVKMTPLKPMCVEMFASCPALGRFAIRDMRATIGVGIVKAVTRKGSFRTKAALSPNALAIPAKN